MNAEQAARDRRAKEIFDHAIERPTPEARAACIDAACGDDALLRRRVVELMVGHVDDSFLQGPAAHLLPKTAIVPITEKPGDTIGHYKLREKIGEGGCGVVYVAEQEAPIRRRVALKVIKLGMDTKSVIARFEAERQALAMMDHPNIARVLDAGATESGRPYFVMELVRGIRITEYCDQAKLPTRERLDLFIKVCQAVQHAHQKGIIHRDIKPGNILVTLHDGVPVPKIIDFGIAKATEARLTDATVYTELHQLIGTPAYMSPEQAEMSGLDIDTRSDIYSLGVLLYELLTGQTPFTAEQLLRSGVDEMRRIIREIEPQRPSTRLSTLGLAEATELSQRRQAKIPALASAIRGDLDWIVMKALEKDRGRRYSTTLEFAADVQRHLNSEAVLARPPSMLYKLQRAARRNKGAFGAAAALLLTLVTGLGLTAWQAVRAKRAETAARHAEQAERTQSAQARADRDRAVLAESNATANAIEATNALQTANERMVKLNVAEGWRRVEEGDHFGALLPFAEAFALEENKPDRAELHQMRLASVLQHCPKLVNVWSVGTNINHAELSKDGSRLLTASTLSPTQAVARIWETANGRLLTGPMEHAGRINFVQWSPDETRLVTASEDKTARIWDGATGHPITTPLRHDLPVTYAAFNRNGTRIVTADWSQDPDSDMACCGADGHSVSRISFHPSVKKEDIVGHDNLVLWDCSLGSKMWRSQVFRRSAYDPAVISDDGRVLTAREILDGRSGSLISYLPIVEAVTRTTFGSKYPEDFFTRCLDRAELNVSGTRLFVTALFGYDTVESGDLGILVDVQHPDRLVALWNVEVPYLGRFSPDGRRLAMGIEGGLTRLWDSETGAAIGDPMTHNSEVISLAFSMDGRRLATLRRRHCQNMGRIQRAGSLPAVASGQFKFPGWT